MLYVRACTCCICALHRNIITIMVLLAIQYRYITQWGSILATCCQWVLRQQECHLCKQVTLVKCQMLVKCVLLLLCYHLLLGGTVSEFTPTVYPAKIVSSSQCGKPGHSAGTLCRATSGNRSLILLVVSQQTSHINHFMLLHTFTVFHSSTWNAQLSKFWQRISLPVLLALAD